MHSAESKAIDTSKLLLFIWRQVAIMEFVIRKRVVPIIDCNDSLSNVYQFFLKNINDRFIVVVLDKEIKGIIYRNDLYLSKNVSCIMDLCSKPILVRHDDISLDEAKKIIYTELRRENDVIVLTDKNEEIVGAYVRNRFDDSDFLNMYVYIYQRGYSISDWIRFYYGNNARIGIHSWNNYTDILLDDLEKSDIDVRFVVEGKGNKRGYKGKYIEKNYQDVKEEEWNEVDLIINTLMSKHGQIEYLYTQINKYELPIVSLYDIVAELYYYESSAGNILRIANLIGKNRDVFIFDYPSLYKQKCRSNREQYLIDHGMGISKIWKMLEDKSKLNDIEELWNPAFNKIREKYGEHKVSIDTVINEYPTMNERANPHMCKIGKDIHLYDLSSKYVNIINGERVNGLHISDANTIGTVHFFGKSWVFGTHCADKYTIPSRFQYLMKQKGLNYCVHNHGIGGVSEKSIMQKMIEMDAITPKDEPFILIHMFGDKNNKFNEKTVEGIDYINRLSSDRPHEWGEIWVDSWHIGEDGTEMLALQIVEAFLQRKIVPGNWRNKFNSSTGETQYLYGTADPSGLWEMFKEYREYKEYLCKNRKKIGSIVMNCNPFTLGHRYLIEIAANQCDQLYIFVVEEDRSIFPFEDRMKLVEAGTKDIKNVTVLKSGRFIISALTFPGYFNKSIDNDVEVDTSADVSFFSKSIAPNLGINVRFAGEEPLDNVTRQYNETMKKLLPEYGIDFVEIPRKEIDGGVISASRVRECLIENRMDELKGLVPTTTYEYLDRNLDVILKRMKKGSENL